MKEKCRFVAERDLGDRFRSLQQRDTASRACGMKGKKRSIQQFGVETGPSLGSERERGEWRLQRLLENWEDAF